jgi:hypothetical protein
MVLYRDCAGLASSRRMPRSSRPWCGSASRSRHRVFGGRRHCSCQAPAQCTLRPQIRTLAPEIRIALPGSLDSRGRHPTRQKRHVAECPVEWRSYAGAAADPGSQKRFVASLSLVSSRILPASPRSTSASRKGKSCATWARLAQAGAGRNRRRSARLSIPSSARSRSSPNPSGNRRPPGSSQVLRRHRIPRHHLRRPAAGQLIQGA